MSNFACTWVHVWRRQTISLGEISLLFLNLDMVLKISYHLQESSPSFDKVNELEYLWWKLKESKLTFQAMLLLLSPSLDHNIPNLVEPLCNEGPRDWQLKYLCYNKVLLYQGSFLYIFYYWALKIVHYTNRGLYYNRSLLYRGSRCRIIVKNMLQYIRRVCSKVQWYTMKKTTILTFCTFYFLYFLFFKMGIKAF